MKWDNFDKGVFLVNVLGIVYNPKTKKILIGRREDDLYIKKLSWCFPGGRPAYENDLEYYLKHEIKIKTGLDVDVKKMIFVRALPEKKEFLLIYYYCEVVGGEEKAGEKFLEIKWVKPTEVQEYFITSTSLDPKISGFLESLEGGFEK